MLIKKRSYVETLMSLWHMHEAWKTLYWC